MWSSFLYQNDNNATQFFLFFYKTNCCSRDCEYIAVDEIKREREDVSAINPRNGIIWSFFRIYFFLIYV